MKVPFSFVFMLGFLSAIAFTPASDGFEPSNVSLKFTGANTPIIISSKGDIRSTKVQAFDFSSNGKLEEVVINLSEPKFLRGLEARIGDVVVGSCEVGGTSNLDPNAALQIPIRIDAELAAKALKDSPELSVWASPSEFAAPDIKITIGIQSLTIDGEKRSVEGERIEYRFGVLVREPNWDGVSAYRIPALGRSNTGTLIAVYDARNANPTDLPGDIDVACSRSFDNGKTWEPMQLAIDFKGEDEAKEGVGDPAILVDARTGRIWIAALWAHNGKSLWDSEPGLKLGTSGQLVLAYSDDDGATWSEPRNITADTAPDKDWRVLFQGPGTGIVTRDGKLVFPAQFLDKDKGFFSTIIWSDDRGETWTVGTGAKYSTCESQVVELNDGSIMINMRNFGTKNFARSVAVTNDLGKTWTQHEEMSNDLPCPICQASLIRIKSTLDGDDSNLLAFMNPNSEKARVDMTLKLSEDEGQTWPRSLTLYRPHCYGYSSIVKIDADTIGALYETQGGLIYQTVKTQDVK